MKVQCFKLMSGVDIIGKMEDEPASFANLFNVDDAVFFGPQMTDSGVRMQFVPITPFAEGFKGAAGIGRNMVIERDKLMLPPYTPNEQLLNTYTQAISRIAIASKESTLSLVRT